MAEPIGGFCQVPQGYIGRLMLLYFHYSQTDQNHHNGNVFFFCLHFAKKLGKQKVANQWQTRFDSNDLFKCNRSDQGYEIEYMILWVYDYNWETTTREQIAKQWSAAVLQIA